MPAWASQLLALRREQGTDPPAPIADAIREARAAGTSLVGDVTNTLAAYDLLCASRTRGCGVPRAPRVQRRRSASSWYRRHGRRSTQLAPDVRWRRSIVPHAPFSVSPALFRAIGARAGDLPVSVHLGESAEEMQFLRDGTGAWRELLGQLGAWNDAWQPPGCGPVEYLDRLGLVTDRLLAVHGTQLSRRGTRAAGGRAARRS